MLPFLYLYLNSSLTILFSIYLTNLHYSFLELLIWIDEVTDPSLTVSVEGHQWYWSYQYPDFLNEDDEELEFDSYLVPDLYYKFSLKEQLVQGYDINTSPLTDKSSLVLFSDISDLNNLVNIDKSDPEVRNFKKYLGSIKRASTLYQKQVDRHSNFQDNLIQVNVSETVLEKRLAKSKANLLRRYEALLEKQVRILNRNPNGSIPTPSGLFDWNYEEFHARWKRNNERNN